jgi:nucleotide-binding universal stress UspA family protein
MKPYIRSILVPTDFSDASVVAFDHALRIATTFSAALDIFHVEPKNDTSDWRWAPGIVETLVRWGDLPAGATEADLSKTGIRARRAMATGVAADEAIFRELVACNADLIVLSTHGRHGLARWLQPSVAAPVALQGASLVLLVPEGVKGFVRHDTGRAELGRVLIPVDRRPHPAPAYAAATLFAEAFPCADGGEIATLHIGGDPVPEAELLRAPAPWTVHRWLEDGIVVDRLVARADAWRPDLIVVVTEGRRNWLDAVRGSTVERLIERGLRSPLLVVPSDWTGEA